MQNGFISAIANDFNISIEMAYSIDEGYFKLTNGVVICIEDIVKVQHSRKNVKEGDIIIDFTSGLHIETYEQINMQWIVQIWRNNDHGELAFLSIEVSEPDIDRLIEYLTQHRFISVFN